MTVNFYTSSSYAGTPTCTWNAKGNSCGSVSASNVEYVGASVGNTATDYFANAGGGSRQHTILSQAVAEVSSTGGSGSGGSSTNPQAACEICVFDNVTINGGDTLQAGGSIDIGGYLFFNSSGDTVKTTNGYGIEILDRTRRTMPPPCSTAPPSSTRRGT